MSGVQECEKTYFFGNNSRKFTFRVIFSVQGVALIRLYLTFYLKCQYNFRKSSVFWFLGKIKMFLDILGQIITFIYFLGFKMV